MGKVAKLDPSPSFKIWGGKKLSKIKNIHADSPLGETWEISTHKDGVSQVGNKNLNELCSLTYLFKFIDTDDNLSIQVHPNDEYAREHENDSGKTECWIILEADQDAGIYLGFKHGITRKEFKTAIENGLSVEKYLNYFPVKPGDYFFVPEGTIHAIGKGVTLAEAQQSSGVTYRVWDWNRVDSSGKSRELHIEKAMDVINFSDEFNQNVIAHHKNIFSNSGMVKVVEGPGFKVHLLNLEAGEEKEIRLADKEGISVLKGDLKIDDLNLNYLESAICLESGLLTFSCSQKSIILFISE